MKIIRGLLIAAVMGALVVWAVITAIVNIMDDLVQHPYRRESEKKRGADNTEINVMIGSVDNCRLHGRYTCEYGESYAYRDGGSIFYCERSGAEPRLLIEDRYPRAMNMNDSYLYYSWSGVLRAVDIKTGEEVDVYDTGDVEGINVFPEGVFAVAKYPYSEHYPYAVYRLAGTEMVSWTLEDDSIDYKTEAGNYVRTYGKKVYDYNPQRETVAEGKLYWVESRTHNHRIDDVDIFYSFKSYDRIYCKDRGADERDVIFDTHGAEVQVATFSVENNQLFTLEAGKLYRQTLEGENKTELADYTGSETLCFEYAGDTVFVYEQDELRDMFQER